MKKKQALAILIASSMALSIVGCSGAETSASEGSSEMEMTEEEKAIKQAHDKYVSLFDEIAALETKLHIYKQDMKTTGDILASLLPKSDCIKYSPVLQIS